MSAPTLYVERADAYRLLVLGSDTNRKNSTTGFVENCAGSNLSKGTRPRYRQADRLNHRMIRSRFASEQTGVECKLGSRQSACTLILLAAAAERSPIAAG